MRKPTAVGAIKGIPVGEHPCIESLQQAVGRACPSPAPLSVAMQSFPDLWLFLVPRTRLASYPSSPVGVGPSTTMLSQRTRRLLPSDKEGEKT